MPLWQQKLSIWTEGIERRLLELDRQTSLASLFLVIGLVLLAYIFPNGVLTGNEEYYFSLAYKYLYPDFPASDSAIIGQRPHMVFSLLPFGYLIDALGFEVTQAIGRVLVVLCYTIALTRLFRILAFSALDTLIILTTFYFFDQEILGDEWLFKGIESKSIAYPFVIFGIVLCLEKKLVVASVFFAIATYFHFLVGGTWMAFLLITQVMMERSFKDIIRVTIVYLMLCVPLLYIIFSNYLPTIASIPPDNAPSMAWIYSVYRNPYTVMPFASRWIFLDWAPRIALLLGIWLVSIYFIKYRDESLNQISCLTFVGLTFLCLTLLISLILSLFGKDYLIGPFFPFRPSSLTLLLWLSLCTIMLRNIIPDLKNLQRFKLIIVVVCGFYITPTVAESSGIAIIRDNRLEHRQAGLNAYISTDTHIDDVFMTHKNLDREFWRFERQLRRPILSFRKFPSIDKSGIYEWYAREQYRQEVSTKGCTSSSQFKVDYIIAPSGLLNGSIQSCGKPVYTDAHYILIRMR